MAVVILQVPRGAEASHVEARAQYTIDNWLDFSHPPPLKVVRTSTYMTNTLSLQKAYLQKKKHGPPSEKHLDGTSLLHSGFADSPSKS